VPKSKQRKEDWKSQGRRFWVPYSVLTSGIGRGKPNKGEWADNPGTRSEKHVKRRKWEEADKTLTKAFPTVQFAVLVKKGKGEGAGDYKEGKKSASERKERGAQTLGSIKPFHQSQGKVGPEKRTTRPKKYLQDCETLEIKKNPGCGREKHVDRGNVRWGVLASARRWKRGKYRRKHA